MFEVYNTRTGLIVSVKTGIQTREQALNHAFNMCMIANDINAYDWREKRLWATLSSTEQPESV